MNSATQAQSPQNPGMGFWALIATQFQGAFSDNLFKMLVVLYLPTMVGSAEYPVTAIAFLLFNIPFLVFPGFAGALSDRLSKKTVTVITKYMEIVVMGTGLASFALGLPALALATLFLMASQSALFSPAKYGLLPEILPTAKLSCGNGILQLTTFLAIIVGTAAAGPLLESMGGGIYKAMFVVIVLSCIGLFCSHFITKPAPADPERRITINPWAGLGESFKRLRADRWLVLTVAGLAFFWFTGVLVSQAIIELGKELTESPSMQSLLLAALSLGIGVGSALAGFLSRGRIEAALVPIGGVGLAVLCFAMGLTVWSYGITLALIFGLGVFAGVFDLPLAAALQQRSPKELKGGMIAASNFVTFSGMTLSALLFLALFNGIGLDVTTIFALAGVLASIVTAIAFWLLRDDLLRFTARLLTQSIYRVQVENAANIPAEGGALVVANHVSYVDALLLNAITNRKIRFMMFKGIYDKFWMRPLAKTVGAIPVMAGSDRDKTRHALSKASEAIRDGEVVVIFAEGGITRTGELMPFKRGLERIMADVDAPIVPVHLGGVWGSIFSYKGGKFFWKTPRKVPYPVQVRVGEPLPAAARADEVREAVVELAA